MNVLAALIQQSCCCFLQLPLLLRLVLCSEDVDYSAFARDLQSLFSELESLNSSLIVTADPSAGGCLKTCMHCACTQAHCAVVGEVCIGSWIVSLLVVLYLQDAAACVLLPLR